MKISNARKVVGLLVLAFTLYLVPGNIIAICEPAIAQRFSTTTLLQYLWIRQREEQRPRNKRTE